VSATLIYSHALPLFIACASCSHSS